MPQFLEKKFMRLLTERTQKDIWNQTDSSQVRLCKCAHGIIAYYMLLWAKSSIYADKTGFTDPDIVFWGIVRVDF